MNLTELKKAAEAATPGPWKLGNRANMALDPDTLEIMAGNFYVTDAISRDATFIALANPATILKLIAVVEAAKKVPISYHDKFPCYTELKDALKELE